ncbi:hypothetical protein E2562_016248 [Oryza meyeriana var. granulata]|uniref:Late embryogenesis abundant protein LEA-2 subgroup domain-containing protein n=1 Tax=Oryza meyeriana var. granulata TaxID=110450 RepID=A0A6G1CS43_9ORYZ|nr:hypothetical protein E2562_016248 [Oryza meyeriana var. granulata]
MAPPTSGSATAAAAGGLEGRKRYVVLAALMGTLAMIAIVSSVSVVLSPAHIFFYITNTTVEITSTRNNIMNVTFVANNTSHHAEVHYHSINIEMWFGSNDRARLDNFRGSWGGWQKPREALVNWASGPMTDYYSRRNGMEVNGYDSDGYPMVVIKTLVQFRYGHSRTRLYSIAVSCPSVPYGVDRNSTTPPVNCTA